MTLEQAASMNAEVGVAAGCRYPAPRRFPARGDCVEQTAGAGAIPRNDNWVCLVTNRQGPPSGTPHQSLPES